jgi:GNAT superfamily N-acetyltransferase
MVFAANENDLGDMLDMCASFFHESGLSSIASYDQESTAKTLATLLDSGILLVAKRGGRSIGMVGAVVYPLYFNHDHIAAQELFWWVSPHQRNTGVGRDLLLALEKSAAGLGVESLSMISLEAKNPQEVGEFYQSNGFNLTEHSYYKRLI